MRIPSDSEVWFNGSNRVLSIAVVYGILGLAFLWAWGASGRHDNWLLLLTSIVAFTISCGGLAAVYWRAPRLARFAAGLAALPAVAIAALFAYGIGNRTLAPYPPTPVDDLTDVFVVGGLIVLAIVLTLAALLWSGASMMRRAAVAHDGS